MKLAIRKRLKKAGWDEKFEFTDTRHYQTTREAFKAIGLLESWQSS
jgi:hypothetical protein